MTQHDEPRSRRAAAHPRERDGAVPYLVGEQTEEPRFASRIEKRRLPVGGVKKSEHLMKRVSLIAAACVLLSAPVLPQSPRPATTGATAGNVSTSDFVRKVATSDMFEIQSSQLALEKGLDSDTKPFAEKMVKDHEQTTRELKDLVQSGKVKEQPPTALDDEYKRKLDELAKLSGKDFDRAYHQTQKQAHQEAVALFRAYAQNGDNPDLKQWAAKTLPHLQEHLSMAEKLK
jgi:putative membrane protein